MRSIACVIFLFLCNSTYTFSQDFRISSPEIKIPKSLYNRISLLDSRMDTAHLGIVQKGLLNQKVFVQPVIPLAEQFSSLLKELTDNTASDGELLLQLRQFSFAELTGFTSEKGFCYLRASLYSKKEGYYHVASLDTLVYIRGFDVTRSIQRHASKVLTGFIADNLLRQGADSPSYTYADILNIDDIEKCKLPLYKNDTLAAGLYRTFESFKEQAPQPNIWVYYKKGNAREVYTVNEKGKKQLVDPAKVYAVVHEGKTYVSTDYGYYLVEKKNNDFVFTGRAKVNADGAGVFAASFFFGMMGGLMASDASEVFEMKIDHLNGGFIRVQTKSEKK